MRKKIIENEIITHFNGTPVETAGEMSEQLDAHSVGDTVSLTVLGHPDSDGFRTERVLTVTLTSKLDYAHSQNFTDEQIELLNIDENSSFLSV